MGTHYTLHQMPRSRPQYRRMQETHQKTMAERGVTTHSLSLEARRVPSVSPVFFPVCCAPRLRAPLLVSTESSAAAPAEKKAPFATSFAKCV